MGLEPNMIASLNGTKFPYTLRGTTYQVELRVDDYQLSSEGFSVRGNESFGAMKTKNTLRFYPHNREEVMMDMEELAGRRIDLVVDLWKDDVFSWCIASSGEYKMTLKGLPRGVTYELWIDDQVQHVQTSEEGLLSLNRICKATTRFVLKKGV